MLAMWKLYLDNCCFNRAVDRTLKYLLDAPESGERRAYSNPAYADVRIW